MKIIVDAFGGDHAPLEILKGCERAINEFDIEIILTGSESIIKKTSKENNISLEKMSIINTEEVFEMEDEPKTILKEKGNTSMALGLKALSENKGDAFISAGSTGALVIGATFIVKRIKSIKRPALGAIMPTTSKPLMLMDIGANTECHKENLYQFALMADVYMKNLLGVENPKIALANIGTEPNKGTQFLVDTYEYLSTKKNLNFIGNIEAREIPFGGSDIVICDGFTGNIILKMYEGVAGAILGSVKNIFKKNLLTKLSALMVMGEMKEFKKQMDYKDYGGAPLLGVQKTVIKAHGSSDARAFYNAIRQGITCAKKDVAGQIATFVKTDGVKTD